MKPGKCSIIILWRHEAASRMMQARSLSWLETAQERLLATSAEFAVNPVPGLTKSRRGTNFVLFRGHLSRPACSHVKKLAKQAGDTSDPGRTHVQAGFFIGLIHIAVREQSAKAD
jgi:hypothetical protein